MTKNLCLECKHYLGTWQCSAFPKKIPIEIISNDNDHSKPLPNQKNDIVFEPISKT